MIFENEYGKKRMEVINNISPISLPYRWILFLDSRFCYYIYIYLLRELFRCKFVQLLENIIFDDFWESDFFRILSRASLREKRERERVRKFFSIENEDRLITDRERRSWTPILGTITPPPPPSPCGWFNEASRTSPKTLQLSDNVTMDRPVPILRLDIIGRGPTPACPRSMQRIR